MNSCYEVPRSAIVPSASELVPTVVPEVSMIFENNSKPNITSSDSMYLTYKAWKEKNQNETTNSKVRSENYPIQPPNANPQKKHLRFNNSALKTNTASITPDTSTFTPLSVAQKVTTPFDQIYMAHIPDRHLDLSVIESTKSHFNNIENINPNVNSNRVSPQRHYLNVENLVSHIKGGDTQRKKDLHITNDYGAWYANRGALSNNVAQFKGPNESGIAEKNRIIDNYNRDHLTNNTCYTPQANLDKCMNLYDQPNSRYADNKCSCNKECNQPQNKDDPTVKDLLKIIQQQNEQVLILQKQVATLLNNNASEPLQRPPCVNRNGFDDCRKTSTQFESNFSKPTQGFMPKKQALQQISLDVMTSFEVSIRRPANHNRMCNDVPHQPKICEVTETDSNGFRELSNGNILDGITKPICHSDATLSLNEPQLQVRERCPTPMNSIQVDMKDYSSESSDEEDNSTPEWTFYNNIMGQVNHILKKSGIQPTNVSSKLHIDPSDIIKQNLMKKVKRATIKHLKSIGVHVPPTEPLEELNTEERSTYNPNDISFAVQQLLMKYLPNDQLTKIAYNQNQYQKTKQEGHIKRRPEFSIATVQYMQKYNLLNDIPNAPVIPPSPPIPFEPKARFDRILDVTAIKQQPKLL